MKNYVKELEDKYRSSSASEKETIAQSIADYLYVDLSVVTYILERYSSIEEYLNTYSTKLWKLKKDEDCDFGNQNVSLGIDMDFESNAMSYSALLILVDFFYKGFTLYSSKLMQSLLEGSMTESEQEIIDYRFGYDKKGIKSRATTMNDKNIGREEIFHLELKFVNNISKIESSLFRAKVSVNNHDEGYFDGYDELSEIEKERVLFLIDRIILSPYSFYRPDNNVISEDIAKQVKQDINEFIELKEKANAIAHSTVKDNSKGIERRRI